MFAPRSSGCVMDVCVCLCVWGCCGLMTLGGEWVIQTEACVTDTQVTSHTTPSRTFQKHTYQDSVVFKIQYPPKSDRCLWIVFFVPGGHAQETISASSASVHLMRPRAPRLAAVRTDSKKQKMRAASPKSGEI